MFAGLVVNDGYLKDGVVGVVADALDHFQVRYLKAVRRLSGVQQCCELGTDGMSVDDTHGIFVVLVDAEPQVGHAGEFEVGREWRRGDVHAHVQLEDVLADHVLLHDARRRGEDPEGTGIGAVPDANGHPAAGARHPALLVEGLAELGHEAFDRLDFLVGAFVRELGPRRGGGDGVVGVGVASARPAVRGVDVATVRVEEVDLVGLEVRPHQQRQLRVRPALAWSRS